MDGKTTAEGAAGDRESMPEEDPFRRRSSVKRTPPGEMKSFTPTTPAADMESVFDELYRGNTAICLDSSPEEITKEGKRRKVAETVRVASSKEARRTVSEVSCGSEATPEGAEEESAKMGKKIQRLISDLIEKAKRLDKEVTINTKREIKDRTASLMGDIRRMQAQWVNEWLEKAIRAPKLSEEAASSTGKTPETPPKVETREIGIQTVNASVETATVAIEQLIDSLMENDDPCHLLARKWPDAVYKNTAVVIGNPLSSDKEWDLGLIIADDEKGLEKGVGRMYRDRFPELLQVEDLHEGPPGVAVLTSITRVQKEGKMEEAVRHVVRKRLPTGEIDEKSLLASMDDLALTVKRLGRSKLAIPIRNGEEQSKVRKIAEITARRQGIRIAIHVPGKQHAAKQQEATNKVQSNVVRERPRSSALIIKKEGSSYAEMLGKVKKSLTEDHPDSILRGVRKTKSGDLMLIAANTEEAKTIRRQLAEKITDMQVRNVGGEDSKTVLHVKDLDALTEKEDVICAVKAMAGEKAVVEVTSLRPGYSGTQVATVTTDRETARPIVNAGRIKVGMISCRVTERVEVVRCYRCWEYGHMAGRCKGSDRSGLCLKCGNAGHTAAECKGESRCLLCEKDGHRMGSMDCPKHRRVLEEGRRRLKEAKWR